ncbi:MAG: sigma-54 dependent transcriptional regulator [Verrucomicrobiota bacterium]
MEWQPTVLIVDDEKNTREGLRLSFEEVFDVYIAEDLQQARQVLKEVQVDVLVTDLRLGGEDGMKVLEEAMKVSWPPVSIMMTAYGSVETAVEAMRRGAYHFVTKPLNLDELEMLIKRAARSRTLESENRELKQRVAGKRVSLERIIGKSPVMQPIHETIRQVAPSKASVLIEGESGTGKELVATAIHELSGRPKDKLVVVHCAALSAQLLESELFGHEKGAFTGATERRIGRLEQADGGTLVLDEIGEIDSSTQVKLLRAIGERKFERVGGNKTLSVDVRVVAATNRDLAALVRKDQFREDLYFRLKVVAIKMPPLRQRSEDVVLLANAFLKEFAKENERPFKPLTSQALQRLRAYSWPGNVRELRTAIEHGVVMSNDEVIDVRHLPDSLLEGSELERAEGSGAEPEGAVSKEWAPETLELAVWERVLIERALRQTGQNRTEAAALLGISRRTLQRKLKEEGGGP